MSPVLLLHGNNLDESLIFGGGILLYLLILYAYSHLKAARLKKKKALQKAERLRQKQSQLNLPRVEGEVPPPEKL